MPNNAQWLVAGLTHVEKNQNLSYEIDRFFIATCDIANEEKPQIIKLYDENFEKTGEAKGTSKGVCAKVKFNRRMFYCQFLSYYFDGFFFKRIPLKSRLLKLQGPLISTPGRELR